MPASAAFADFLADLFAPLGAVRAKRMFGGAGLYAGAVMFGIIVDDVLYLKADEASKEHFRREGMKPFTYRGRGGRRVSLSYYAMPERLYDEPDEAVLWGRRALSAAVAVAVKKAPRKSTVSRPAARKTRRASA